MAALLGVAACLAALALSFAGYVQSYRSPGVNPGLRSPEGQRALLRMALATPARLLRSFRPDPIERFQLDIRFRNFQKLRAKRDEALERGILLSSPDDFVPALLRHGGREVRVRVRLKGDLADHLAGEKWSFRVEVRGGESVLGMQRFSLQAPYTRRYHHEALFFDFLRDQGVLAPRYFFVDLTVNGEAVGRMALEEHFSSELLEAQSRRRGVIVRYDEQYFWRAELAFGHKVPDFDNWRNAPLDVFRRGRIAAAPELTEQMEVAFGLIRGVMQDRLAPSQAFDAELWGRFLAACEIWSAPHATHWNNLRFYMNPLTVKLEPIAFDATVRVPLERGFRCAGGVHAMTTALLEDPELRAAFLENLRRFAKRVETDDFERWLREREAEYLPLLTGEFSWLRPYPVEELRARARVLSPFTAASFARDLRPQPKRPMPRRSVSPLPTVVYLYRQRDDRGAWVELANAVSRPVTITDLGVQRDGGGGLEPLPGRNTTRFLRRLPATPWPQSPKLVRVDFPEPVSDPNLAVGTWNVAGRARLGDQNYSFQALDSAPPLPHPPLPQPPLSETLERHSFLSWDPKGRRLVAESGRFDVAGSIALPPGVGLHIGPGTTLRFEADAMLLARGPLEFLGSAEAPVVLEGRRADRRGPWWGVVALGEDALIRWSHVVVRDTTGPKIRGWGVTGGVTLRGGEVSLADCVFDGSQAEDALNVVRSKIALRNLRIRNASSDAIDVDYSEGRIEGGEIRDVGGDGIDVGASQVEIESVSLSRIGDKAVSVGESSEAHASRLEVSDARMGVVSKDLSTARVVDSVFRRIDLSALMAYQKKSQYGPGELVATDVQIRESGREALAQLASRISIDGREVEPEPLDVDALYPEEEEP